MHKNFPTKSNHDGWQQFFHENNLYLKLFLIAKIEVIIQNKYINKQSYADSSSTGSCSLDSPDENQENGSVTT